MRIEVTERRGGAAVSTGALFEDAFGEDVSP
jgi:hypothetical protein